MKRVLFAGEMSVDLVLQGHTEFPVPGQEVLVEDFAMVLGSATVIMASAACGALERAHS